MTSGTKIALAGLVSGLLICAGASLGSAGISPAQTAAVIFSRLFRLPLESPDPSVERIVWNIRFPRAVLAFIIGGALSVSGAVFQSILKNQLASPYIVGVSSGASLGAGIVMLTGFTLPLAGGFTLPLAGFVSGFASVIFVAFFSAKVDRSFSNNTIILLGMVFSLFINAIITTLLALYREQLRSLIFWQMGSLSLKGWSYAGLMLPFLVLGTAGIFRYAGEMDILSFGDEQAASTGVDTKALKMRLLVFSAALTGAATALCGAIGFVDLAAPHLARKIAGSRHRYVLPMSFFAGGCILILADLAARTVVSPSELPVGAVTALIGAPFFAWVYFGKNGKRGKR